MVEYVISCRNDGLGARIIHATVAARMACVYGLKHLCVWKINNHCGINIRKILCHNRFMREPPPKLLQSLKIYYIRTPFPDKSIYDIDADAIWCKTPIIFPWRFPGEDLQLWKQEIKHVANQCIEWNYNIQRLVDDFCEQHDLSEVTAVHVRRGDIARRPGQTTLTGQQKYRFVALSTYFQYLDNCDVITKPIMVFTQDDTTAMWFQQRYGNVLKYPTKHYGRGVDGIQEAAVELLLMSRCKQIVAGPSAFSQAASLIGYKPLTLLQEGRNIKYVTQTVLSEERTVKKTV
jgi:hypothetical protein